MDTQSKQVRRGSAREILRESRARFEETISSYPIGAYVDRASDLDSLARASWRGLGRLVGFYCRIRAVGCASESALIAAHTTLGLSPEQVVVVAPILLQAPWWMGRQELGRKVLDRVFESSRFPSAPFYIQALLWCMLGEVQLRDGFSKAALDNYAEAEALIPSIEKEAWPGKNLALIRVCRAVGFFYLDHGDRVERWRGKKLVFKALNLATQHSEAERGEIVRGLRTRKVIGM